MISYEQALKIITTQIPSNNTTKFLPIFSSVKHISAQNIHALTSLPLSNLSLKDGFALTPKGSYEVSTGDNLKEGTICVIPFEERIPQELPIGYNIKNAGEDIQQAEMLLRKGEYINAHNITPLASQGIQKVKVYTKPRVSILSIGDNLCPIQKEKDDNEIYNSNALTFASRILEIGANIHKIWLTQNKAERIVECIEELSQYSDLIFTTGAMSHHDAMSKLIYGKRFEILFHKVQLSPASPSALSIYNKTPVLSLPGLPLSSLLGFEALGVPLLKTVKNENLHSRKNLLVSNAQEFTCKDSCTSVIPGYFDGISFLSAPSFKAGMLNVLSRCNGYALIQNKEVIEKGEKIKFFPF